jgi:large subunit ribosomal protein L9
MPHKISKSTEIILLTPLRNHGDVGDVVHVKNGFARNFLLPRNMAVRANDANRRLFAMRRGEYERRAARERALAVEQAERLAGLTLLIRAQASPTGRLYGAVSTRQIAQAAAERGIILARDKIRTRGQILSVGRHQIDVVLHADIEAVVEIVVGHPSDDLGALLHDGATIEDRHHLAFEILDRLAIDQGRNPIDATAQLVRVVDLADADLGLRARDALRNQASGPFETFVRRALDRLDVDCLFSITADVDGKDDSFINFRARLCAALPVRIGNSSFIRLIDGHRAENCGLELSLFSPAAEPVGAVTRHVVLADDDEVERVEVVQSLRRVIPADEPPSSTEVWASAHLNGSCVHRRVWSFI